MENNLFDQIDRNREMFVELDRDNEIRMLKREVEELKLLNLALSQYAKEELDSTKRKIDELRLEIEKIKDQGGHSNGKRSGYHMGR
jgi:chromosome segregation ATPase